MTQTQLAQLCGIQRRQLSTLERGGNVTLNTLRKVLRTLPNLQEFAFEQVRMRPRYLDLPTFEWADFYQTMRSMQETLEGVGAAVRTWNENPPGEDVDLDLVTQRSAQMATDIMKMSARINRQNQELFRKIRRGEWPASKEETED